MSESGLQPTAAQWAQIGQKLRAQYNPVWLDCDGYIVRLVLDRVGNMKLGIAVHVDGWFRGEWLIPENETEEGRRFFQTRRRYLWNAGQRARIRKANRRLRRLGMAPGFDPDSSVEWRLPHWSSFNSLRRHLVAHNEVIRLLTADEAGAQLGHKRRQQA